jgi:flagella basal body P-ring formation protein FlgA
MILTSIVLALTGGITVTLPAAQSVAGTELELGAVATVTGTDQALVERARKVRLGYAPAPGYSRVLQRDLLAQELRSALGLDVELHMGGATACHVTPLTEDIDGDAVAGEARRAIAAMLTGREVELTLARPVADLVVPAALEASSLRARPLERALRPGRRSVAVDVLVDGAPWRTVWTTWDVAEWTTVPALVTDVARGTTLSAGHFAPKRVPVGAAGAPAPLAASAYGHAVAARDLRAGDVVEDDDVQRVKVLSKGDLVSVEVVKGAITARALGEVQREARVGDRVSVVLRSTGREVTGVVLSRDLVRLRL